MNLSKVELPSNKKFGYFLTLIFLAAASYFYIKEYIITAALLIIVATIFCFITLIKAELLLSINKLWMQVGLFLGMIVSPIVLGLIFFMLFTPIAILMRMKGRDELHLKFKKKVTYWISRKEQLQPDSFKNQF